MVNSPVPADRVTRTLITTRNGKVISEEVLPQNVFIGSARDFYEIALQTGLHVDLMDDIVAAAVVA